MKNFKRIVFSVFVVLFMCLHVNAETMEITNTTQLESCNKSGNTCVIKSSIEANDVTLKNGVILEIDEDGTLNLSGNTYAEKGATVKNNGLIVVKDGVLDISKLDFSSTSGLISNQKGLMTIKSTGRVIMLDVWNDMLESTGGWSPIVDAHILTGCEEGAVIVSGERTYIYRDNAWVGGVQVGSEYYDSIKSAVASTGKTIKLLADIVLEEKVVIDKELTIDLNNHKLIVKGIVDYNRANPILITGKAEIKNGTIERYVLGENETGYSLIRGSLIIVEGENASLTLNKVVMDAKKLTVSTSSGSGAQTIYVKSGSLYVNDTTLKGHYGSGEYGGAIRVDSANTVEINNSIITDNKASKGGSAVEARNIKKFTIKNTEISNNAVTNVEDDSAAGTLHLQYVDEFVFDKDSVLKNNTAPTAGGMHIYDSNAVIEGTFEGNEATHAEGNGGGIYTTIVDNTKKITITETAVFKDNIAGASGGGIYVNGENNKGPGLVIINGATITGNKAKGTPNPDTYKDGGGAGIYVRRGSVIINDATIKDNTSTSGYGDAILVSHANGNPLGGLLEINGGTIIGKILVHKDYGKLVVTGGKYSLDIKDYVKEGLTSKKLGEYYVVGKENTVTIEEVKGAVVKSDINKALAGEKVTLTLTPSDGYLVNLKVLDKDGKEIELTNNEFTMPDSPVTVKVNATETKVETEIPVVDTKKEVEEVTLGIKDETNVESILKESLAKDEKLKEELKNKNVKIEVSIDKVEEDKIDETVINSIKEKAGNKVISEYFDIDINVKDLEEGKVVGTIDELTKEIEIMVLLPKNLKTVEEGKTRKYYIVRNHIVDGKNVVELIDANLSSDGNYLVFKTNKFSTYALLYEDVEKTVETPKTGDSIIAYIALGFVSIGAIYLTLNNLKKRNRI